MLSIVILVWLYELRITCNISGYVIFVWCYILFGVVYAWSEEAEPGLADHIRGGTQSPAAAYWKTTKAQCEIMESSLRYYSSSVYKHR